MLPEDATDKTDLYESSGHEDRHCRRIGVVKPSSPPGNGATIAWAANTAFRGEGRSERRVPVETITLPDEPTDGVTLKVGEVKPDIAGKVTITPGNATNTEESYESSVHDRIGHDDEGIVTAIAVGETTITVTVDGQVGLLGLICRESRRRNGLCPKN